MEDSLKFNSQVCPRPAVYIFNEGSQYFAADEEKAIRTIPEMVTMRSPYANEGFRLGVLWALEQIRKLAEDMGLTDGEVLDTAYKSTERNV